MTKSQQLLHAQQRIAELERQLDAQHDVPDEEPEISDNEIDTIKLVGGDDDEDTPHTPTQALVPVIDATVVPAMPVSTLPAVNAPDDDDIALALPDMPDTPARRRSQRKQGERLTHYEINAILHFHRKGKTQVEIARRVNCTQATVSNILREYASTKLAAKAFLEANTLKLAERVVETGDAAVAAKMLKELGGITKDKETSKHAPTPVLIVGKFDITELKK